MELERLDINISADTAKAISSLDALSDSLNRLEVATGSLSKLQTIGSVISSMSSSIAGVDFGNMSSVADDFRNLSDATKDLKISSSIKNQLEKIGAVTQGLNDVDLSGIEALGKALSSVSNVSPQNVNALSRFFARLPGFASAMNGVDWETLKDSMDELNQIGSTLAASNINSVTDATKKLSEAQISNASATAQQTRSYTELYSKLRLLRFAFNTISDAGSRMVGESMEYVEDLNLFNIAMGRYAVAAKDYADQVSAALGIDPADWMRNQGVFNTIITGFGVASDKAQIMSKNLTQLAYDLSSYANLDVTTAMQKVQSGIAGELEPLRRLGYDLSVARLQQEAYALGIKKTVQEMTQAEKSQLRYYTMMKQVSVSHTDMARTLNSPANQLRVLTAQFRQLGRAIGNVFIPAISAVVPYVTATVIVLRDLATSLAKLVGFKPPKVDDTQVFEDMTGDISDAEGETDKLEKKMKKLQRTIMGFDEMNVLNGQNKDEEDELDKLNDAFANIEIPEYDFLGNAVQAKTDAIVNMIKTALGDIQTLLIASAFALAIGTILVVSGANIPIGLGLMAAGAVGLVTAVSCNWDSMTEQVARTLALITAVLGGFLLAIGIMLVVTGANIPLGLALVIGGLVSVATSVAVNYDKLGGDVSLVLQQVALAAAGAMFGIGVILLCTGNIAMGLGLMLAAGITGAVAVGIDGTPAIKLVTDVLRQIGTVLGGFLFVLGVLLCCVGNLPLGIGLIVAGIAIFIGGVAAQRTDDGSKLSSTVSRSLEKIGRVIKGIAKVGLGIILCTTGIGIPLGLALIVEGAKGIWKETPWSSDNLADLAIQGVSALGRGFSGAWANVQSLIHRSFGGINPIAQNTFGRLHIAATAGVVNIWNNMAPHLGKIGTNMVQFFSKTWNTISTSARTWGSHLINNFVNGIAGGANALVGGISGIATTIWSYLHFSEPEIGPLSNFNSWMPDMMSQMAQGIQDNTWKVDLAAQNVAETLDIREQVTFDDSNRLASNRNLNNEMSFVDSVVSAIESSDRKPPVTYVQIGDEAVSGAVTRLDDRNRIMSGR